MVVPIRLANNTCPGVLSGFGVGFTRLNGISRYDEGMSSRVIRALIALLVLVSASSALAQTVTPQPRPPAGFQDGFFLQSGDGEYRLNVGFVAQVDGRFSVDDPTPIVNTFTLRKLRPTFTGQLTRYFAFKLMPDFGSGKATVPDAYIEARLSPAFRIRTGKDKTPVGYELLQGDAHVWFPERSLATSLVPNRDIGAELVGEVLKGRLSYQGGVFGGVPDGASTTTELDTNNSKDLAGRIVINPFRTMTGSPLYGFGIHLGASTGDHNGALPSFKTSVGQSYFSYAAGAQAAGTHTRMAPAIFYYFKSFGAFAEYMNSEQAVARDGVVSDIANHGMQISGSLMLTGEAAAYGMIRPKDNFNPAQHHWGALQVLARYAELSVDQLAFDAGLASAASSRDAKSFTLAMNWFPNANVKYYATFERTTFDGGAVARPAEDMILFRTQNGF
jgi:phosphate-selective porin OprO/OprP